MYIFEKLNVIVTMKVYRRFISAIWLKILIFSQFTTYIRYIITIQCSNYSVVFYSNDSSSIVVLTVIEQHSSETVITILY